jgi:hypothetical protein
MSSYSDSEEDRTLLGESKSVRRSKSDRRWFLYRHWEFICVQLFLLCIYTVVFFSITDFTPSGLPPPYTRVYCEFKNTLKVHLNKKPINTITAPAQEAVRFEKVRYNATLVIDSPYNGLPGPDVDKAWSDLLESELP